MMNGSGMFIGYWSIWHWILFAVFAALVLYPIGRILARIGFSPFWSVIALIPLVNLVGLWIVALVDWPRKNGRAR
jgi:predicted PurR-regulated permease PerM